MLLVDAQRDAVEYWRVTRASQSSRGIRNMKNRHLVGGKCWTYMYFPNARSYLIKAIRTTIPHVHGVGVFFRIKFFIYEKFRRPGVSHRSNPDAPDSTLFNISLYPSRYLRA